MRGGLSQPLSQCKHVLIEIRSSGYNSFANVARASVPLSSFSTKANVAIRWCLLLNLPPKPTPSSSILCYINSIYNERRRKLFQGSSSKSLARIFYAYVSSSYASLYQFFSFLFSSPYLLPFLSFHFFLSRRFFLPASFATNDGILTSHSRGPHAPPFSSSLCEKGK